MKASLQVSVFFSSSSLLLLFAINSRENMSQNCLSRRAYNFFPLGWLGRANGEKHENILSVWIGHQDRSTGGKSSDAKFTPLSQNKEYPWSCLWKSMTISLNSPSCHATGSISVCHHISNRNWDSVCLWILGNISIHLIHQYGNVLCR